MRGGTKIKNPSGALAAFRLTRKRILAGMAAFVLAFGFFSLGFISSRHLRSAARNDDRKAYLAQAGNATPSERTAVLAALRVFQEGYVKRDPRQLDAFMNRLFVKDDDVLLMGTDSGEWRRGYSQVAEFIGTDWTSWGDFRFAVDDSIVWCAGDVAWIVSIGTLREHEPLPAWTPVTYSRSFAEATTEQPPPVLQARRR